MENKVFVKIEEYKDVTEIIDLLRNKIAEAKHTIEQIESLKSQEEETLREWKGDIKVVEEKVTYLDNQLVNPQL